MAVGGVVGVTAAIGAVEALASVSGLSALHLLFVLWVAARWGRGPAVAASVAAFLLYDFFFVPPVGTFTVRGPAELLELVVLLAVALVTSQLAASLRRAHATAEALAADSQALYELATAMLRTDDVTSALAMIATTAQKLGGVDRFAVVGEAGHLAGSTLSADEVHQARWAYDKGSLRPLSQLHAVAAGFAPPAREVNALVACAPTVLRATGSADRRR